MDELKKKLEELEKRVKALEDKFPSFSDDELLEEARKIAIQYDEISASLIQRRLSVGYARAARILDELERDGLIGSAVGGKPRKVFKEWIDKIRSSRLINQVF